MIHWAPNLFARCYSYYAIFVNVFCSVFGLGCSLWDLPKNKKGMGTKRMFFSSGHSGSSLMYLPPEYRGTSLVRTWMPRWFSTGKGFQKGSGSTATGTRRIRKAKAPSGAVTAWKPLNEKRVDEIARTPYYVS